MKAETGGALLFKLLRPGAREPLRAKKGDLGFDLFAMEGFSLGVGRTAVVGTGVACAFPAGWGALVLERSSQGKLGVHCLSKVVDNGYRGEVHVVLQNGGDFSVRYKAGDRIAQLVPVPLFTGASQVVDDLGPETERGSSCFGSSGR